MKQDRAKVLPREQIDRFREAARALDADEDGAAFKEKLGRIARQKPKDQEPSPKDAK